MPGRRSVLRAGVAMMTAPLAAACQTVLGPSKTDSNWDVQERGRFTFYARSSSFAAKSIDQLFLVLDDQCDYAAATLDVQYRAHVSMFLYDSNNDAGFPPDVAGVAYSDTQTVRAVCAPPLDGNLMARVSHELNHLITRNALGQSGTYFMTEGIASAIISERYHSSGRHFLFPWTASRLPQLPAIAALLDDDHWNDSPTVIAYNTSASFLAWLVDLRGPAPLRQVFVARSKEISDRMESAYGKSVAQLEADWKTFVAGWTG